MRRTTRNKRRLWLESLESRRMLAVHIAEDLPFVETATSRNIAVGDVNGDGADDIAAFSSLTYSANSQFARVYSGRDGAIALDLGNVPNVKAMGNAGDVNNDGYDDLLISNRQDQENVVHLVSGLDGTYLWTVPSNGTQYTIVGPMGDVNFDGVLDVLVTQGHYGPFVEVLSGVDGSRLLRIDGAATEGFALATTAVGDVNADGIPDIVVGAPDHDADGLRNGAVYVYSGSDGSQLLLHTGSELSRIGLTVAVAGDVNNDGFDDIIAGGHGIRPRPLQPSDHIGTAVVLSGRTGEVLFSMEGLDDEDNFGLAVTGLGDWNRDGVDDFAIAAPGQPENAGTLSSYGAAFIYSGHDGTVLDEVRYTERLGTSPSYALSSGDFDGDGFAELLLNSSVFDTRVYVLGTDGYRDHRPDVAIISGNELTWYINRGHRGPASGFARHVDGVEMPTWSDIQVADFNNDGFDDLAGRDETGLWQLLDYHAGRSIENWGWWSPDFSWHDIHTGDFDGDGLPDTVGRTTVGRWFMNRSTGSRFSSSFLGQWDTAVPWQHVVFADFDGDGALDIAGLKGGEWWISTIEDGQLSTQKWGTWSSTTTWRHVRVGDFDGDGLADILGQAADGTWWSAKNDGGRFLNQYQTTWPTDRVWNNVVVGDFDLDGKDDWAGRDELGNWIRTKEDAVGIVHHVDIGICDFCLDATNVVAGDFDGDGDLDLGGFTNSIWSVEILWVARNPGEASANLEFSFEHWLTFLPKPGRSKYFGQFDSPYLPNSPRITTPPLVTIIDNEVTAVGLAADDDIVLSLGEDTHELNITGFEYSFDANEIDTFYIGGATGHNKITVIATDADDRASILGPNGTLTSDSYTVKTFSFDETTYVGMGGYDYGELYGSNGDDELVGLPIESTLTSPSHTLRLKDFERVDSYGRGGDDLASVYGSNEDDLYYTTAVDEIMTGGDVMQKTKGFERVDSFGRGGVNSAVLTGTAGDDAFAGTPVYSVLQSATRLLYVKGFANVQAYAGDGENDQAAFFDDEGGTDQFRSRIAFVEMIGASFENRAYDFDIVTAYSHGGADMAEFFDLRTLDAFSATGQHAIVRRDNREETATGFATVVAVAFPGHTPSSDIHPHDFALDIGWL